MTIQDILFYFDFQLVWTPQLLLLCLLLATCYLLAVGRYRDRFADSTPVDWRQRSSFLLGLFVLYLGLGSPLNFLGHFALSFHMFQQAILYLILPPLILRGMPAWMLAAIIKRLHVKKLLLFFNQPVVAVLLFNALFSFYHLPLVLDTVMNDSLWNNLSHYILILAAFNMWMPVLSPLAEAKPLSELRRLAYMFANGVLITPACALIIFASAPLYETYLNGPQILCTPFISATAGGVKLISSLTSLEDQQLGGIAMKLIQELVYFSVLASILYRWFKRENADDSLSMNPRKA